ncbi:reverse transcriptase family protein [Ferruginibacter sp.]
MKYGEFQRYHSGKIKYRKLIVPDHNLKCRQQRISQLLNKIVLPDYMFGSIKGKNNIQNAQQHLTHKYFLTVDLKKYFTNINHHQVNKVFNKNGFSPSVSRILTQLTTYQGSLPQGVPSSPIIANLIFLDTGNKLYTLAKDNGLTFTTFLDDLTFSSNQHFKNLIPQIINIIKQDNFYIAHEKIHYRKDYCEVTGIFVKGSILELPFLMQKKTASNYNLRVYKNQVMSYNLISSSISGLK